MFQLDEEFLKKAGLESMAEEHKKPFLSHIYEELEIRVGSKLSEGMNELQLDEFGVIATRDDAFIKKWLSENDPNYDSQESFKALQARTGLPIGPELRAEYSATKWLELNRPDYRSVVAETLEQIRMEIEQNRDAILGIVKD